MWTQSKASESNYVYLADPGYDLWMKDLSNYLGRRSFALSSCEEPGKTWYGMVQCMSII